MRRREVCSLLWRAVTALVVDDEHHLWAHLWTIDGDPVTWDVFASPRRFLGTVVLPPDLYVLQIANGYLLERYTYNPNDSELRLYKLAPPQ